MKNIIVILAINFSSLWAFATPPVWVQTQTTLLREAAVVVSYKTCLEKTNILGQVYVLANVIESISLGNSAFSNDVYPQAVMVKSYGVNARFHEPCRNTDPEVFAHFIEDLRKLEIALSK